MEVNAARERRLDRAHASLDGLSVGDAFGECLFHDQQAIELRLVPPPRWVTTDDTEMAVRRRRCSAEARAHRGRRFSQRIRAASCG